MLASRNFTIKEIAHRELPQDIFYTTAAAFQMGCMQMIRFLISKKFGDVPITITSGYRPKEINDETQGAAKTSLHIWGIDEKFKLRTANDFVLNSSKVDPYQVYLYLKDILQGELIYYEKDKHFHYSPSQIDQPYVQK